VPRGLELDTFGGCGFVAGSRSSRPRSLRPAGFPTGCGQDFFLAGYRACSRRCAPPMADAPRSSHPAQRCRSLTMVAGGNALTHYNYHLCEVVIGQSGRIVSGLP